MKKNPISVSFSLRLSLYILFLAAIIFIMAFVGNYHATRNFVKDEAIEHAQAVLDNTILQIDNVLNSVETAVHNFSWLVIDNLDSPNYMYTLTQQLLESNPYIVGSAIAFEPSYYPEMGVYYSPYAYREGDYINLKQLGTEDYDYHYLDWYQIPKLLGKPYWSEPYFDEGGADVMMTTYSLPIYNEAGKMIAIFTADISLKWFAEKVSAIHPYPNSTNMMIGRGGSFLVHKRPEAILNETVFASMNSWNDEKMKEIGHRMVDGHKGMATFDRKNSDFYLFYAPVKATGWSVAVICLHSDVFEVIDNLRNMVCVIGVIGLLLMTYLCYYTIKRLTNPLERFARSATEIAHGNFKATLPNIHSKDEMKTLHDSFKYMQESLVNYMEELKRTTANKERIESELRIAREIQMGMVPKIFPPFPNRDDIDLYANLKPAKEVGGDLYDFFIDGNKFYFIVGDVSGKGIPASLVMAVTCRLFRTVAAHFDTSAEIVTALNDALAESNESNMFCTFFIGILDLETGHLQYCNAGHNAPVLISPSGEVKFMEVLSNFPLGLFGGFPYEGQECTIEKGTAFFLYTDGVTEAENVNKELYSDERLLKQLSDLRKEIPRKQVEEILADIERHAVNAEQSDDITIMCFHYK